MATNSPVCSIFFFFFLVCLFVLKPSFKTPTTACAYTVLDRRAVLPFCAVSDLWLLVEEELVERAFSRSRDAA